MKTRRKQVQEISSASISQTELNVGVEEELDRSEAYLQNCKQFDLQPDSSVLIALKTNWPILQPTKNFSEGSMLPLMGILDDSATITKVNLSNVAMNDSR